MGVIRIIRNVVFSGVVLALSFAFVFFAKMGEMPTIQSSRKALSVAIPLLDDSCRFPRSYMLGFIDRNFHLEESELRLAVREAEAVWESGTGRDLFREAERSDSMRINVVFDARQKQTDSLKEASSDIETRKKSYEALRLEYEAMLSDFQGDVSDHEQLVSSYEERVSRYEARVGRYNDRLRSHEALVSQWNREGGAPPNEYEELRDEREALKKESAELEDERDQRDEERQSVKRSADRLNAFAAEVNTSAGNLNRLASDLNITVDSYNRIAGAREEFTTGLFTEERGVRKIDIFQFYDHADLVRILVHEMGHALGIEHATGTDSVMYPSITEGSPVLSDEDRRLLEGACPSLRQPVGGT